MGSTAMFMCLYTMDGTKKRTLLFPLWSMVKNNLILFQERGRARMLQCAVLPWRSASSFGPSTKRSYLHGNIDSPLSWMAGVVFTIHQSFSARFTVTMTCTGTHGSLTHHLYVYVSVFINYNVCESDWFL